MKRFRPGNALPQKSTQSAIPCQISQDTQRTLCLLFSQNHRIHSMSNQSIVIVFNKWGLGSSYSRLHFCNHTGQTYVCRCSQWPGLYLGCTKISRCLVFRPCMLSLDSILCHYRYQHSLRRPWYTSYPLIPKQVQTVERRELLRIVPCRTPLARSIHYLLRVPISCS